MRLVFCHDLRYRQPGAVDKISAMDELPDLDIKRVGDVVEIRWAGSTVFRTSVDTNDSFRQALEKAADAMVAEVARHSAPAKGEIEQCVCAVRKRASRAAA